MAGAGFKDWAAGNVLTAADLDTYLMHQAVMQFATSTARDTALSGVLDEGLLSSQADSNSLTAYSGSAWSTIGPLWGALTSWTPTVTQTGSVTVTNNYSRYIRIGRLIAGWFSLTVTGSGSGSANIVIGAIPATAASTSPVIGQMRFYNASGPSTTVAWIYLASTTTFGGTTNVGVDIGSLDNLANTDKLDGFFFYEAASDA
jgi:hypothetical protein